MSKVQFNLLPSVKLDYIKAETTRTRVTRLATAVSLVSIGLLMVMILFVQGVQRKQLKDAGGQITSGINEINNQPQMTKILTVQNQLSTLVSLHADKSITSRVFDDLVQLTPLGVNLARLSIDYSKNTISLDGTADSAANVNKFADTLKFTNYTLGKDTTTHTAFSSVIVGNFNISSSNVSYSLNVTFDPVLFSNNIKDSTGAIVAPTLKVPSQTTTRSALSDPTSIFGGGQ